MKFPLLYHAVYSEPHCIDPQAFRSVHSVLWPRIEAGQGMDLGDANAAAKPVKNEWTGRRATRARPGFDEKGQVDNRFYFTAEGRDDVAIVPVYGILAKNAGFMEEVCYGITDINGIQHAIAQAAAAKEIKTLVLDLATPGGQVTGIPEMGELIRSVTKMRGKTVYAWSDEQCCSAGYWLGSQADEFYSTPSATIGSIGVYLAWFDETVKMQLEGRSLEFFGAGKHKGMGLPGKPLTQDDRQLLQAKVDRIYGWFTSAVTAARPRVSTETMQGQTFNGDEAEVRHLVDGLVGTWDQFLSLI